MEIQVGEYVRVMGIITKLFKIESKRDKKTYYFDRKVLDGFNYLSQYGIDQLVRKHSFNIIDLIEVGDFVNDKKVKINYKDAILFEDGENIVEQQIKSIVTKEMFQNVEYRVESN